MPLSLLALCLWVIFGSIIAFLPMRHQMIPGSILFFSAFALIIWIGADLGWIWSVVGLGIFISLFRRPFQALARRLTQGPEGEPEE